MILDNLKPKGSVFALVNCRADRGDRSRQMAEVIDSWQSPDKFLLIGSGVDIFLKHVPEALKDNCLNLEGQGVDEILEAALKLSDKSDILMIGVCNIAAIGFQLVNYFEMDK